MSQRNLLLIFCGCLVLCCCMYMGCRSTPEQQTVEPVEVDIQEDTTTVRQDTTNESLIIN